MPRPFDEHHSMGLKPLQVWQSDETDEIPHAEHCPAPATLAPCSRLQSNDKFAIKGEAHL
jgi:hypothetical protein